MKATQVFYEGRVQGVGFRWSTKNMAQGFDVSGFVRNLPDGRVELQLTGDADEVKAFLGEMRESTLAGHITAEQTNQIEVDKPFRGFQIVT